MKVINVPYIFTGDEKRSLGVEVLKVRVKLRCSRKNKPTEGRAFFTHYHKLKALLRMISTF